MNDIEQKEILMMALKAGASSFPVVGQLFNDLLDFRGKVKQERFNNFIESLAQYLTQNANIELDAFKEEEFTDLFEAVIKRVVQTKSSEKHERFQQVLLKNITDKNPNYDNSELFLELISSLSEIEILVLKNHYLKDDLNHEKSVERNQIEEKRGAKTPEEKERLEILLKELEELQTYESASFYNIKDDELLFCNQSLYSKALLVDNATGMTWISPFTSMRITEFGKKFFEYIKT